MREILFRGKDVKENWHIGLLSHIRNAWYISNLVVSPLAYEVIPSTIGEYTGLTDKNGKKIFEGDIVRYNTVDDFDCHSVVRFGKYNQDGSGGEYHPTVCFGWFVEVDNFTAPDFFEPTNFEDYLKTQNLLEVALNCEIIGNIHDNPELLEEI